MESWHYILLIIGACIYLAVYYATCGNDPHIPLLRGLPIAGMFLACVFIIYYYGWVNDPFIYWPLIAAGVLILIVTIWNIFDAGFLHGLLVSLWQLLACTLFIFVILLLLTVLNKKRCRKSKRYSKSINII